MRVSVCIDDALQLIDSLGLVAALCNGASNLYSLDKSVNLNKQCNYVCLNEIYTDDTNAIPFNLTKSNLWFEIRKKAKATGSTLHKAAGLSTLKEQQNHYNIVNGLCKETSICITAAMEHGIENEINGIGVLVSKILPIFKPNGCYYEEGCYSIKLGNDNDMIIVSPDGSCRNNGVPTVAIEVKCPLPGKKYTPDVHYKIPDYYVCQILSEMKALGCEELFYLCWTPQSSTVFRATYDNEVWMAIFEEIKKIYCSDEARKPKKCSENVQIIKDMIKKYNGKCVNLLGEFLSVVCIPCEHEMCDNTIETAQKHHMQDNDYSEMAKRRFSNVGQILQLLLKTTDCVTDMYNILRTPGKEVLVAMMSDLDRIAKSEQVHAIPIAYGISGYSLEVEVVRSILLDLVNTCNANGLHVRVLSSDGQFYKFSVRSKCGEPLTLLQLAKDTWTKAKQMPKCEQIRSLMSHNCPIANEDVHAYIYNEEMMDGCSVSHGPLYIKGLKSSPWKTFYNPPDLEKLLKGKDKVVRENAEENEALNSLPPDVLNSIYDINDNQNCDVGMPGLSAMYNLNSNEEVHKTDCNQRSSMEYYSENNTNTSMNADESTELGVQSIAYDAMVEQWKELDNKRKKRKWASLNEVEMKRLLSSPPDIPMKKVTKQEIQVCANIIKDINPDIQVEDSVNSLSKLQLVNLISNILGDKSTLIKKKSPKRLRAILKDYISMKFGKNILNAIFATDIFINEALPTWRRQAVFKDGISIGTDPKPYTWYSQPEYFPSVEHYVLYMLDCHHLFVNARCFVVQNGIAGLNIRKQAWLDVAVNNNTNNVGLNVAMVTDVIDRQSNAIAQITFSEAVENEMRKLGWENEANFCRCIRNWYRAEDEPGLDVMKRHEYRIAMREMLLGSVNLSSFPPPGSHVIGMPIVMFEGILTNIDRRIQLYELIPGKSYNVRAPITLDVENLFSEFKDVDPKSSGALVADDIPIAMETACYVMQMRLNPNRQFHMNTSRRIRVYPASVLQHATTFESTVSPNTELRTLSQIAMRNHAFDKEQRRRKPKRKSARVPKIDEPAKGTRPVREHHRMDSSKILPHVRYGLKDI